VDVTTSLQKGDEINLFPPAAGGKCTRDKFRKRKSIMHVFIAGIMQGERRDDQIDDQRYRVRIAKALKARVPGVKISDPWALNPDSVNYDEEKARQTFHTMTKLAGEADLLIAYLPSVSMGTAMEMWEAAQNGTYIIAVTPFVHHWAIRFTADEILPDLDSLLVTIENGRLSQMLESASGVDALSTAD
jgi:NAD-dependent SIR2 family protein deacetylase